MDHFLRSQTVIGINLCLPYAGFVLSSCYLPLLSFDFTKISQVVSDIVDVHFPVTEMVTRSKLSCLSWNKYIKEHIASTDYDGVVTIWDVNTRQSIREYEEHERRACSVDFSRTDPTMLVSGSDDGKAIHCEGLSFMGRKELSSMYLEISIL